jgi:hypothetical protein
MDHFDEGSEGKIDELKGQIFKRIEALIDCLIEHAESAF